MEKLFKIILSLSISGSLMAAMIIMAKIAFNKRLSAHWHYYIWFLLMLRLMIPYSSELIVISPEINYPQSQNKNYSEIRVLEEPEAIHFVNVKSAKNPKDIRASTAFINEDSIHSKYNDKDVEFKSYEEKVAIKAKALVPLLSKLWLAGTVVILTYLALINLVFYFRFKKLQLLATDDRVANMVKEKADFLGISSEIEVVYSNEINCIALWGFTQPILMINSNVANKLSEEEMELVVLHELIHFRRRDTVVNWVAVFIKAVYWFNPLIWYATSKMKDDCEISCDAAVLSHLRPIEHKKYASTIIGLLKLVSASNWESGVTGILNRKSMIKRRINMINGYNNSRFTWVSVILIIAVLLMGCVGIEKDIGEELLEPQSDTDSIKEYGEYLNFDLYFSEALLKGEFRQDFTIGSIGFHYPNAIDTYMELTIENLLGKSYLTEVLFRQAENDVTLKYGSQEDKINLINIWGEEEAKKLILLNSATLLMADDRLDAVKIVFDTELREYYIIHREDLEKYFGRKLIDYRSNIALWQTEVLEATINSDSRVISFFDNYYSTADLSWIKERELSSEEFIEYVLSNQHYLSSAEELDEASAKLENIVGFNGNIRGYRLSYTYNLEEGSEKPLPPILQFSYITGAEKLEVIFTDYDRLLKYKAIEITDLDTNRATKINVKEWQNYEEMIDNIMNNS